jgi:formylglycine-generating enzyme required for sulfatase activity
MRLCINPNCRKPENADNQIFCQNCGSEILLAGRYKVTQLLSDKGGFGKTYQVEDSAKNNIVKVLKVLTLNVPKAVELFQQEAAVLQQLNHPGIPQGDGYIEFFPKNSQDPLHCFVMQYIQGVDLEEYLNQRGRPIDQKMALKWLKEIAEILQVVHGDNFFHRDIKPSNIMLQPTGKLALIDFGTAREVTGTYMAKQNSGAITKISSAGFTPPEQENNRAGFQSDFFALGRTFVYLLTGKLPNHPEIYDAYNNELKWRQFAKDTSPLLADLIDELMAEKASQRPDNPGVILRKLADIERQLYPPPKPTQPPKPPQPPQPQRQTVPPTVVSQPFLTRRKLIKVAGFGGVGIMGGFVLREFLFDPPQPPLTRGENPVASPLKNGENPLTPPFSRGAGGDRFSFEVVKVNDRGEIIQRENLEAEYFTEDIGNGVTLEMVAIPGGTFMMGYPEIEKERYNNEGPKRSVTVPAFFMAKYPVTQTQWQAVMGNNPSRFQGLNRPVENVNWNDAVEFCQKLSQKTGKDYRLPSEAEWEYACRAGTTTPFYFGETITPDLANYNGNSTYGNEKEGVFREQTTDVDSFPPNAFGLYDMHGNVWEWCQDVWHENYNGAPTDGSAWESGGDSNQRLLRGGGWDDTPEDCRSACRGRDRPGDRSDGVGFRIAVSLPRT